MNKKVLSALLFSALFAGTGTFTSCIDNDEPEGIENIRGAKAELIRAQAAFELAEEAWMRAQVANQELLNEAQRLENKRYEIETELSEIDVQLKKLELERTQASTEQHKAEADAKIAEAQASKLFWENQMALEAEKFKESMANAQKLTLAAQAALEKAVAEAELAKMTLSDAEKVIVQNAIDYVASAADILNSKHDALIEAQKNFDGALLGEAGGQSLSKLTAELNKKNAALNVQEVLLQETKDMLDLAKNFSEETWSAQMKQLEADIQAAEASKGEAKVALTKVYVGEEYQKADDAYVAAVNALGEQAATKGEIDGTAYTYTETELTNETVNERGQYAANYEYVLEADGTTETQELTLAKKFVEAQTDSLKAMQGHLTDITDFEIEEYESAEVPAALVEFFTKSGISLNSDNKFAYLGGSYTEEAYQTDLTERAKDENYQYTSNAAVALETVEGWIGKLGGFTPDANGQAWLKFLLEDAEDKAEKAKAVYEADLAAWAILKDAVNGTKKDAGTEYQVKDVNGNVVYDANIKAAVNTYNTVVTGIAAAVKANNDALDALKAAEKALYDAGYDAKVKELKDAQYKSFYISRGYEKLSSADKTSWDGMAEALKTIDNMAALLGATEAAKVTTDATSDLNNFYKSTKDANGNETNADLIELDRKGKEAGTAKVDADYAAGTKSTLAAKKADIIGTTTTDSSEKNIENAAAGLFASLNGGTIGAATVNGLQTVYSNYLSHLASDYGQLVKAKNLTKVKINSVEYAVNSADYVSNMNPNWNVIYADLVIDVTGYEVMTETKNNNTSDVTYQSLATNGEIWNYYVAVGSDISADEFANLTKTEIDHNLAVTQLKYKSETVFGNAFDWSNTEARLVAITEAEVKAHMEENQGYELATEDQNGNYLVENYGTLGVKMYADEQVQLYTDMQGAEELVAPVKAELEAHLTALKAEIAANSAVVAEYVKAADDAWTAVLAGRKAIEAAEAARDEICAEAKAEVLKYESLILELTAIKTTAGNQLENLKPDNANIVGDMTVEKLIAYWEVKLADEEAALETLKGEIAQVEKAIELFEAGNYDEAYEVALYKSQLEAAQVAYDAAYAVYEKAVADLNAIMEALLK